MASQYFVPLYKSSVRNRISFWWEGFLHIELEICCTVMRTSPFGGFFTDNCAIIGDLLFKHGSLSSSPGLQRAMRMK